MNLWKIKIKLDQQKKKQFEMLVSDFWVWNNTWVNYVLIEIEARTAASKAKMENKQNKNSHEFETIIIIIFWSIWI